MNTFLSDLYYYIVEHTPEIRNNPEYEQALQSYMEIEAEVKEKTGDDLLYKYQCAEACVSHHRDIAVFVQILRYHHSFMLEVLQN